MKKILIILLVVVLVAAGGVGGFLFYQTTTPEYALAKTIADVNASGMEGLKPHLTEDAVETVESLENWADNNASALDILSSLAKSSVVSVLEEKMTEIDWTVEDVLKGSSRAEVVIGFNYNDSIVGTINITMVRAGLTWKIDGLEFPDVEKLSLP